MAEIILLTESKISSDFNKYDEVAKATDATKREDVLPHDTHLNIVLLGSILKEHNYDVELIDNFLHLKTQFKRLERELDKGPMAVGISTTFFYDNSSLQELISMIRTRSPGSCIILGGPSLLQFSELIKLGDISVLYDGDEVIVKIMDRLKRGKKGLKDIPGIYIKENDTIHFTGERPPIEMNKIPFPDWELMPKSRELVYPIETQRGCPYSCKYCTYPVYSLKGGKYRLKDNQKVIDEIKRNFEKYGIYRYRICDSNFTTPTKRALKLSEMIVKENLNIEWSCYGRVDNMGNELAVAMKEAGCKVIFIGIESGSDMILRNMNKKFSRKQIYSGIKSIKRAGISITGSFIVGFPGETEQTVMMTKEVILNSGLDCYLASFFWLDHNSQIWREREKYGLTGSAMNWSHDTMDSNSAKSYLSSLIEDVFKEDGPPTGSDFDVVSLVNHGLSYEQALEFIRDRHQINRAKFMKKEEDNGKILSDEKLKIIGARHSRAVMSIARHYHSLQHDSAIAETVTM
jgi:p-methyltransferase